MGGENSCAASNLDTELLIFSRRFCSHSYLIALIRVVVDDCVRAVVQLNVLLEPSFSLTQVPGLDVALVLQLVDDLLDPPPARELESSQVLIKGLEYLGHRRGGFLDCRHSYDVQDNAMRYRQIVYQLYCPVPIQLPVNTINRVFG